MSTNSTTDKWKEEISDGKFVRPERSFRSSISSSGEFPPEPNRYHLYVAYCCPWASRTLAVRKLKGLEDVISFDVVDPQFDKSTGWTMQGEARGNVKGSTGDTVNGCERLKEIYLKADPSYDQSVTVPVLWDKKKGTIVNNESSEIIRMLNSEFNQYAKNPSLDLYPEHLRPKIDEINDLVYNSINNGVYKCGFAQSQEAYDESAVKLFDALDRVEDILSKNRYLVGNAFTEADVRLFMSLVRFDIAYHTAFKCNRKRIIDYPNLWNYTREIYQMKGVSETVDFEHIKYYYKLKNINPHGIIPIGPLLDFNAPHNRNESHPIK